MKINWFSNFSSYNSELRTLKSTVDIKSSEVISVNEGIKLISRSGELAIVGYNNTVILLDYRLGYVLIILKVVIVAQLFISEF